LLNVVLRWSVHVVTLATIPRGHVVTSLVTPSAITTAIPFERDTRVVTTLEEGRKHSKTSGVVSYQQASATNPPIAARDASHAVPEAPVVFAQAHPISRSVHSYLSPRTPVKHDTPILHEGSYSDELMITTPNDTLRRTLANQIVEPVASWMDGACMEPPLSCIYSEAVASSARCIGVEADAAGGDVRTLRGEVREVELQPPAPRPAVFVHRETRSFPRTTSVTTLTPNPSPPSSEPNLAVGTAVSLSMGYAQPQTDTQRGCRPHYALPRPCMPPAPLSVHAFQG